MGRLHRSEFLRELKATFPEIREVVNQEHGLLHLEMHGFRNFTQSAIDGGRRDTVRKCFQLADKYIREGRKNLVNALAVFYLEDLNFEDGATQRRWAKPLMSSAVAKLHSEITEYNLRLWKERAT